MFLVAVLSAALLYGSLVYLDYFTHHGQEISVPDLTGMNKSDLEEFLSAKSLHFVILDSVYVGDRDKGIVVAQNPEAFSKVKEGRTIYLTVNALNPPRVNLPLVIDKSLRQAISILENSGLVVGELQYVPDQCTNCVLGQKIKGFDQKNDTVVPKGTLVDLIVGGGLSDEKVLVPLLAGLRRQQAIARLKSSFLNLGAEIYDNTVFDEEDTADAMIFAQHPPYSERSWVFMGSSVDVEYTMLENKVDSGIVLDSSQMLKYNVPKDTL